MDSVFPIIDKSYSNQSGFWIKGNLKYHDTLTNSYTVLIHSSFMVHSSSKTYKVRLFVLTTDKLYCFNVISYQPEKLKSPGKFTFISWKKVEPFEELSDSKVQFGIRIIGGYKSVDLYTEESDQLEKWLDLLSGLCVMVDFSNDYEMLNCINNGHLSDVYRAYCYDTSQIVAVKAISKSELMRSSNSLNSLIQEISTMRKMNSRRILKLRRVYETSDCVYLITDFYKGGDLLTRINKRKNFSERNTALIITGILNAVKELHSSGIMHRDLKLDNILLYDEESDIDFTISDFGLASDISHNDRLICGSPGYIAPEMLRNKEYNEKVDIFSIGVILLSGRTPFEADDHETLLKLNERCKIQFNNAKWKGISQEAVDAVLTLMEVDPAFRPSSEEALEHPWLKMHTSGKHSKASSIQKYYSHLTFKDPDELVYFACNSNFIEKSKSNLDFDSEFQSKETWIFRNLKLSEDCLEKFEETSSYLSICFLDAVGFNTADFEDSIGFIQKLDGDIDPVPMGTFEFDL